MPPGIVHKERSFVIPVDVPIIDLTQDDDNELTLSAREPPRLSSTTSPRASDRPSSNHGLIMDASFREQVAAGSRRREDAPRNSPIAQHTERPPKRQKLLNDQAGSGQMKLNFRDGAFHISPPSSTSQQRQGQATPPNQFHRDLTNTPSDASHHQDRDGSARVNQVAPRSQNRPNSGVRRSISNEGQLRNFLKTRVVPRIVSMVQRYAFRGPEARSAEKNVLARLFHHKDLERQVTLTRGRLSNLGWKMLDTRAEQLVARIAADSNVPLRSAQPPSHQQTATKSSPKLTASNAIITSHPSMKTEEDLRRDCSSQLTAREPTERAPTGISNKEKKANKSARMSEIMRARWASGEMDFLVKDRNRRKGPGPPVVTASKHARGELSIVPQACVNTGMINSSIPDAALPSESSDEDYGQESASSSPINVMDEAHIRSYSSSPTTSFSAEGTKENSSPRRLQRVLHIQESSLAPDQVQSTIQPEVRITPVRSQKQVSRRPRQKRKHGVAAHHEKDGLRFASLDPSLDRPYLEAQHRSDLSRGLPFLNQKVSSAAKFEVQKQIIGVQGTVLHVDFCADEIKHLIKTIQEHTKLGLNLPFLDPINKVERLMSGQESKIPMLVNVIQSQFKRSPLLAGRSLSAISAFFKDAAAGDLSKRPAVVRINGRPSASRPPNSLNSLGSMLLNREIHGRRRSPQWDAPSKARIIASVEDAIIKKAEFTDCAGDIATITWLPRDGFVCGAVTHSDEHNQQYNKPGNLMVGSTLRATMTSIAGHRVVRPIIENGENSRPSMVQTQDPWLYTSVTTTAYSHYHNKCFTGSFDNTVKIWDFCEDRSSLELCGSWYHDGHVNFVMTSPEHDMIATAADVRDGAIRVYNLLPDNLSQSEFSTYSGERADEQALRTSDSWAYFPATIQWGISPAVSHLLLVGYSPRSYNPHDDVPEIHANTGELCLWNMLDGSRVSITSARTQNVFEVVWHPTQPIFVAATSPTGVFDDGVQTQLRIFGQTELGTFGHMTTLDCEALDINEITIMPNSQLKCYVTASCTNGCTYVWDSAEGDRPIRILCHGDSIDDQAQGGDDSDNGVKFAAWGKTADRFYTGSSDGVVKCWNVRAPNSAVFVRDVATLSGGVTAGAFSPEFDKLLIGDSTGKVHLFSLDETEPGDDRSVVVRKILIPHSESLPPASAEHDLDHNHDRTAAEIALDFINKGQIVIHENSYIGAIQGPNYAQTSLFAISEHKHNDPDARLRKPFRKAQAMRYEYKAPKISCLPSELRPSSSRQHRSNLRKDLDVTKLEAENELDLDFAASDDFNFEIGPRLALLSIEDDEPEEVLSAAELQDLAGYEMRILQELKLRRSLNVFFKELTL